MSPTSRGRRPKRKATPRSRRRDDDVVAGLLREIGRDLAAADDALDAELAVSIHAGAWWDLDLADADPEVEVGERLVAYAASRRGSRPALALLRVLAEIGTPGQRTAAAAGAAALAESGVPDPAWVDDLSRVEHTGTWAQGDVFGDQTGILLLFDRPGRPHGIMVLVDHTLGGIAKDAVVIDDPSSAVDDLRAMADDLLRVRELSADEAAAVLVPAFAATDIGRDLPLDDDFHDTRALALARLRLLPAPPAVAPAPEQAHDDPARVAAEFLASDARPPAADADPDADPVAACARLVARLMADIDGDPARVSPAKLDILMTVLFPAALDDATDPDPVDAVLPVVLPAWVGWAADRAGLSAPARDALADTVEELLSDAGADIPDELVDALLDEVPEDLTADELTDVLRRRTFAMGSPTAVVDGEELAIDPSDPDERGLVIRGEHPEYAAALADPFHDAEVDGVNPRLHVAMHEMVANQLWDGEPAELWPAAQRLLDSGMDRHDVLHALADVAVRHVHASLVRQRPYNAKAYAADLRELGAVRRPRRR